MKRILNFLIKHNFIEEYPFGVCRCGNEGAYFNVNRTHWFYCNDCKTRWLVGSNLFSSWREETEKDWEKNVEEYGSYKEIKPAYNSFDRLWKQ
jgi:hypothetical protein